MCVSGDQDDRPSFSVLEKCTDSLSAGDAALRLNPREKIHFSPLDQKGTAHLEGGCVCVTVCHVRVKPSGGHAWANLCQCLCDTVSVNVTLLGYSRETFKVLTVCTVGGGRLWHFGSRVLSVVWSGRASCPRLCGGVHASQRGRRAADLPLTGPVDRTLSPDIFYVTHTSWQYNSFSRLRRHCVHNDLLSLTCYSTNDH